MTGKYYYSCLICKKKAEEDRAKGFMHSIMAWIGWDSKKEVIKHIKKSHPKEYKNELESSNHNKTKVEE